MIDKNIEEKIRKIFENPKYYGRKLSSAEIEEIANNLLAFADNIFKKFKNLT